MLYHLNINIGNKLTGIEKAAVLRHKLLKDRMDSKIVTVRYNYNLKENTALNGMKSNEVISLYDFFQDSINFQTFTRIYMEDVFPKAVYKTELVEGLNDYRVYQKDKFIAYVHLLDNDQLSYINYFDKKGIKRKRVFYDSRGFLSSERILVENQRILMETFFSPDGKKRMEKFYDFESKGLTRIIVYEKAMINFFSTEEELISYFLEKLLTIQDIAVSDKNILVAKPLSKVQHVGKKIIVLHSKHYKGNDHRNNRITDTYSYVFDHLENFDHVICSTEKQHQDLVERFANVKKFSCIPAGVRKEYKKNDLEISPEKPIQIAMVARYFSEKRLDHGIKVFKKINEVLPNTELHLFGFGNSVETYKTERELIQLVKNLDLTEVVKFRGYIPDLTEEYQKTHVLLLTSLYEGFCLSLLEGISRGIPAISYAINYGPSELIESGVSGYLVKDGMIEELADKAIQLLSDQAKYQSYSKEAYNHSKLFSEKKISKLWENLLLE